MTEQVVAADYEQRIVETVADFCLEVVRNPLCYFSEADLQLLLAEALRTHEPFRRPVPTQVHRGEKSKGTYGTPLLHREYGGGNGTRIDIVILDPNEVRQIDNANLTVKGKYLTPLYAFELGTEKTQNARDHLQHDLTKLRTASRGYVIHFFKDTTKAKTGTDARARTEAKVNRIFREAFARRTTAGYEHVRILALLLRTGRNQRAIRGKCEVFTGETWVKANVSRGESLRNAILDQLR